MGVTLTFNTQHPVLKRLITLGNIFARFCHELFAGSVVLVCLWPAGYAQLQRPFPGPVTQAPKPSAPKQEPRVVPKRAETPGPNEILVHAVISQEVDGPWRRLRGQAQVETAELLLKADEIDYNENTGYAEARGNVYFQDLREGQEMRADLVEYNLKEETGKFYMVSGSSPAKIDARPGVLMSGNPYYFSGLWAQRLKNRYILHEGLLTNCKLPKPWWTLAGPKFDIVPGERALAYRSFFRVRKVPVFYAPVFYKSLEERPRKSGFLTPNVGNSSRRGKMLGAAYYWAINRSYDALYRAQLFTQRGFAHNVDFRGKPAQRSEFNYHFYGVNDRGLQMDDGSRRKEGGYLMSFYGRAGLGRGWEGRAEINYLSSFLFRQSFTESFNEATFSETNSIAFATRRWSYYSLDAVFARHQLFFSTEPDDQVTIRRLPTAEFSMRDRQVRQGLPVWVSLESSAGFVRRRQLQFQTRQFVDRLDVAPTISSALRWKDFHLIPSLGARGTLYGESIRDGSITGRNLFRGLGQFDLELVPPSLERTFRPPKWVGEKLRHVIEPRAAFRHVWGVDNYRDIIRFDEIETITNTTEAEFSLINRFFASRNGQVHEAMSIQVWQRRYFDPDFGGAVVPGQRNVLRSSLTLTGLAFIDQPRRYSPVVGILRANLTPRVGVEWRTDYDPLREKITNSTFTADARAGPLFFGVGHNQVRSSPLLSPGANQLMLRAGFGEENRRGWSAGVNAVYDYRISTLQFLLSQATYNTDCCGLSIQLRRFDFGTRNETQFLISFSVANIGSFGTLRKQERLF